jgi:hypothetical protein
MFEWQFYILGAPFPVTHIEPIMNLATTSEHFKYAFCLQTDDQLYTTIVKNIGKFLYYGRI